MNVSLPLLTDKKFIKFVNNGMKEKVYVELVILAGKIKLGLLIYKYHIPIQVLLYPFNQPLMKMLQMNLGDSLTSKSLLNLNIILQLHQLEIVLKFLNSIKIIKNNGQLILNIGHVLPENVLMPNTIVLDTK